MVELRIHKRDNEVSRYSFDSGSITIGRGLENEVHLNSPSVSPQHARLSLSNATCSIQNLASKGGTFVNNLEIKRAQLYDKDTIRIGNYSIEVSVDRAKLDTPAQPEASATSVAMTESVDEPCQTHTSPSRPATESAPNDEPKVSQTHAQEQTAAPANTGEVEERDEQEEPDEALEDSDKSSGDVQEYERFGTDLADSSLPPLHGTGVDVLSGPAQGKRVYFTRDRAALGLKDLTAVVIKSARDGYVAEAPNKEIVVTLNGSVIAQNPVPLDSGDLIAFSNLKARFFIEAPAD